MLFCKFIKIKCGCKYYNIKEVYPAENICQPMVTYRRYKKHSNNCECIYKWRMDLGSYKSMVNKDFFVDTIQHLKSLKR